ncbi:hypothetical protein GOODEAATRI_027287 [Goodea atripinnis]|uniref:Uncharacterized protein n=1 Tax=Goodea atripinnis TaxID=208336 RepID=A0ABV0Q1G7_9TELE
MHYIDYLLNCGTLETYYKRKLYIKQIHMLPALSYSLLSLLFVFSVSPACLSVISFLFHPCLILWVNKCRHLYQSPCCGRGFLWPRLVGSLSLCLLEAVLAHLEEQDSVSPHRKWPPRGLPRSTSSQLHSCH